MIADEMREQFVTEFMQGEVGPRVSNPKLGNIS